MGEPREWRVVQPTDNKEYLVWASGEFVEKSAYDELLKQAEAMADVLKLIQEIACSDEFKRLFHTLDTRLAMAFAKRLDYLTIGELTTANAELIDVLRSYASFPDGPFYGPDDIYHNIGEMARDALAKHGGKNG